MSERAGDGDLESLADRVLATFPDKVSATFPPVDPRDAAACVVLTPDEPNAIQVAVLHRFFILVHRYGSWMAG